MAKRGGRPPKAKHLRRNTQLNMRIKDDLRDWLDSKIEELEQEVPGVTWNRTEVARHFLYKAFKADEPSQQDGP